jgi:hypothetical protein
MSSGVFPVFMFLGISHFPILLIIIEQKLRFDLQHFIIFLPDVSESPHIFISCWYFDS